MFSSRMFPVTVPGAVILGLDFRAVLHLRRLRLRRLRSWRETWWKLFLLCNLDKHFSWRLLFQIFTQVEYCIVFLFVSIRYFFLGLFSGRHSGIRHNHLSSEHLLSLGRDRLQLLMLDQSLHLLDFELRNPIFLLLLLADPLELRDLLLLGLDIEFPGFDVLVVTYFLFLQFLLQSKLRHFQTVHLFLVILKRLLRRVLVKGSGLRNALLFSNLLDHQAILLVFLGVGR